MRKVVAFGASSSKNSINQKLAVYAASLIHDCEVDALDLNDHEMPIYSIDREQEIGIPEEAKAFKDRLRVADGIIISFAEHNGSFTSAFKNVYDWASRVEREMWLNKPVLLMATSPGARGAISILNLAVNDFPHRNANVVGSFCLPSFGEHFGENGISDTELLASLRGEIEKLQAAFT